MKVQKFKHKDFEIEFSPMAFIPDAPPIPETNTDNIDDMAFYSSNIRRI
jgi:hypothetical protein